MYNNPYLSNMMPQMQQNPYLATQIVKQEVVKVNGENGARAFTMGPNSSALLLDESGSIVWLVITDGAGYKSVAPYDITPHQITPTVDFSTLEARISKLEELINNDTPDFTNAKRKPTNNTTYESTQANKGYDAHSSERK